MNSLTTHFIGEVINLLYISIRTDAYNWYNTEKKIIPEFKRNSITLADLKVGARNTLREFCKEVVEDRSKMIRFNYIQDLLQFTQEHHFLRCARLWPELE